MKFLEVLRLYKGDTVVLPLGDDALLVGLLSEYKEGYFSVTYSGKEVHQQVFSVLEISELVIGKQLEIVLGWGK